MNDTKICTKCNKSLPLNNFSKCVRNTDGLQHNCKLCLGNYHRTWYKGNPYLNEYRRELYQRTKLEVFNHYTNNNIHCQCPSGHCTETHLEFMSIDHIDGGGTQHRKKIRNNIYSWLKARKYPSNFRVLCMNCNYALGMSGKCPHSI